MNLTPKQLKILQLIRDHRIAHGYSPTMQELADEIGVSKVTVFEHVEALIKKNALRREPNKARSLSLVDESVVPDEAQPLRFPLVGRIAERFPDSRIVISAFAISGYTFARKAFPDHRVIYFPADLAFIIRRFFRVLNPVLIIVVESEFWPNFFAVAERSKIPLCVLNGKMSAKSFLSHRRTGLIPWALRKASLFAVQTENHAARFRGLGISTASIHVTGNMKYDLADDTDGSEERRKLRSQYGLGDDMAVWIGGSIHRGEDEALAWAQSRLVRDGYLLQLIVVPRYPAEAPAMVDVFERLGLKAVCKTELSGNGGTVFSDPRSVLVVDTIGDLKRYYAMSDIASKEGVIACPEGSATLVALKRLLGSGDLAEDDVTVLLNTGSGYKYLDLIRGYGE